MHPYAAVVCVSVRASVYVCECVSSARTPVFCVIKPVLGRARSYVWNRNISAVVPEGQSVQDNMAPRLRARKQLRVRGTPPVPDTTFTGQHAASKRRSGMTFASVGFTAGR